MTDLEMIKKYYGEQMAHFCRDNFSTILETDGLLYDIISSHFAPSKLLYEDIVEHSLKKEFKNFIYSFITFEEPEVTVVKTPSELLDEAGYILYECQSEADIQSFRKYYLASEKLCTFNGGRLEDCFVFFAVKKDVDEIKREDFKKPMRQDKYGTSVISIQFSRGEVNTLSIKNRYNHTVDDPDSTFSNDLENIIAGLTKSFEQEYNLNINSNQNSFEIPGYILADDGRFYKYNIEINGIYYCPDNIIIDHGKVVREFKEKERYILFDYFILDLHERKIFCYDKNILDDFINRLSVIEKNELVLDKKTGIREVTLNTNHGTVKIKIDKKFKMISYCDDIDLDICDGFLYYDYSLEEIELKNAKKIGNCFLYYNGCLKRIDIPKCEVINDNFLNVNNSLETISLPNVQCICNCFLNNNITVKTIDLPNCLNIGKMFMQNSCVQHLYFPKVEHINSCFMMSNISILDFCAPNLQDVEGFFLNHCKALKKLYLPNLYSTGYGFLEYNNDAKEIYMPKVETIGDRAFHSNKAAEEIDLPSVTTIGDDFFISNRKIKRISMPKVETIGCNFLALDPNIEEIDINENVEHGSNFLSASGKFVKKR